MIYRANEYADRPLRLVHPAILIAQLAIPAVAVLALAALVAHHEHGSLAVPATCAIGAGTLLVYCLDRLLDRRDDQVLARARRAALGNVLFPLLVCASIIITCAMIFASRAMVLAVVALGLMSVAYPYIKVVAGVKTLLVASAWTMAVSVMVTTKSPSGWHPCAAIFLIIAGSTILCDLKDAKNDRVSGIQTVVVIWGRGPAIGIACTLCLLGAAVAAYDAAPWLVMTGLAQIAACTRSSFLEKPVQGPLLLDALLALLPVTGLFIQHVTS